MAMAKIYFIQLIGVLLIGMGMAALTAVSYLYGKPLTRAERRGAGLKNSNVHALPINLETLLSAAFLLGGIGLLTWSKFSVCAFLGYWLPDLPDAIMFLLACAK
jgi:hypothetical protein